MNSKIGENSLYENSKIIGTNAIGSPQLTTVHWIQIWIELNKINSNLQLLQKKWLTICYWYNHYHSSDHMISIRYLATSSYLWQVAASFDHNLQPSQPIPNNQTLIGEAAKWHNCITLLLWYKNSIKLGLVIDDLLKDCLVKFCSKLWS